MVDVRLKVSAEGVHAVMRKHQEYTDGARDVGGDEKIEVPAEVVAWMETLLSEAKTEDVIPEGKT